MTKKGFTLIEVLVTIVIFALGVLALAGLQILSIKNTTFNKGATAAAASGQRKMEELKGLGFAGISGGSETLSASSGNGIDGIMSWTATLNGTTAPDRYKEILLGVCWDCSSACGACDTNCTTCKKIDLRTMVAE